VADGWKPKVAELKTKLKVANATIARLKKRIAELEKGLRAVRADAMRAMKALDGKLEKTRHPGNS
jgi:prefoldin subunit 5